MDKLFKFFKLPTEFFESFGNFLTDNAIGYELITNITEEDFTESSIVVIYDAECAISAIILNYDYEQMVKLVEPDTFSPSFD